MASQHVLKIGNERLPNMAANLLHGYFVKANKELAKKRFKEINDGKVIALGSLEANDKKAQVDLNLLLDSSEFRGHLTFHLFHQALVSMLQNYTDYLPDKKKAPLFSNEEQGAAIFLVPGIVENQSVVNMLVLGIESSAAGLHLKLQFIDPEQFRTEAAEATP